MTHLDKRIWGQNFTGFCGGEGDDLQPWDWVARHGLSLDGLRRLGARRGQRLVRSMQSPADGLARPGNWSPWGLRRSDALRGVGQEREPPRPPGSWGRGTPTHKT